MTYQIVGYRLTRDQLCAIASSIENTEVTNPGGAFAITFHQISKLGFDIQPTNAPDDEGGFAIVLVIEGTWSRKHIPFAEWRNSQRAALARTWLKKNGVPEAEDFFLFRHWVRR